MIQLWISAQIVFLEPGNTEKQPIVYCVLCTCTVYCVLCVVYCVLCIVYCVLCIVYCVLCTVYCVLCIVYFINTG